jgi:arylsulfatase A-like enzyme
MTGGAAGRRTALLLIPLLLGLAEGLAACSPADERAPAETDVASHAPAPTDAHSPRIILLLSIDTLRADHLGSYGHERFTSPGIDLVAAEGTVFEDASATAPWTLPSHASLLTGLFPVRHQVMTMKARLADGVPTLASMLAKAGYDTAAVVNSTWLGKNSYQLTRDFDKYLFVDTPDDRVSPNTWVTDQAITWLRESGGQRLFLFVHYYDVHSDYASLPEFEKLFVTPYEGPADGTAWQLQTANLEPDYIAFCRDHFDETKCSIGGPKGPTLIDGSIERIHLDKDDMRHLSELYDAGIRQMDTELGRLFAALRHEDLYDQTLLVVTSDHGEEFGDHERVDHFITQYQEMLHVPLILRGPGVPAGMRIQTPVSSVDLAPTLLAMAGAERPADLDGLDLSPLLRGDDDRSYRERTFYGEAAGGLSYDSIVKPGIFPVYFSVRQGRHKLVYESKAGVHALYDLETDPHEQRDVSAAHPELTARLMETLQQRRSSYSLEPPIESRVDLSSEDIERLRALGYLP